MTPATLTALAAELLEIAREHEITGHSGEVMQKAAAILEQVAGADAVPVRWEFRWINPRGEELLEGDTSMAWKAVEPAWNQTMAMACADLEAYRFEGKPCYEVRALYHLAALTAQSGEGVALYEALTTIMYRAEEWINMNLDEEVGDKARAAIAAYEAKRGGVPATDSAIGGKGA